MWVLCVILYNNNATNVPLLVAVVSELKLKSNVVWTLHCFEVTEEKSTAQEVCMMIMSAMLVYKMLLAR